MKNLNSIVAALLILFSVGISVFVAYLSTKQTLTGLESILWQIFVFAASLTGSFIFGQQSARKGATDIVKPHARSALRRLASLYRGLSRAAEVVDSAQQPEPQEDYQVTLARLQEIVAGQLLTADNALEDWRDILPEVLEEFHLQLHQKLRHEDTTEDKQ